MPTPDTARVYPGGCLVEGTNLSEGRGTTRPFELVGAPWIEPHALAEALSQAGDAEGLDGVLFRGAWMKPGFQKHAGKSCGGVQVHVVDRDRARPFATYLVLLRECAPARPGRLRLRRETYEFVSDRLAIDLLFGRGDLRGMVEEGASLAEMEATVGARPRGVRVGPGPVPPSIRSELPARDPPASEARAAGTLRRFPGTLPELRALEEDVVRVVDGGDEPTHALHGAPLRTYILRKAAAGPVSKRDTENRRPSSCARRAARSL
jgi:hypothetical protein